MAVQLLDFGLVKLEYDEIDGMAHILETEASIVAIRKFVKARHKTNPISFWTISKMKGISSTQYDASRISNYPPAERFYTGDMLAGPCEIILESSDFQRFKDYCALPFHK